MNPRFRLLFVRIVNRMLAKLFALYNTTTSGNSYFNTSTSITIVMCCAIDNTVTVSTSHARRIGYQLDQHSKDVHMLQAHSNVQLKKKKT